MRVKRIEVGIRPLKDVLNEFASTWEKLQSGGPVKKKKGVYFESIEALRKVLTPRRLEMLKLIREEEPKSVYELAKLLRRDIKNVNQDIRILSGLGFVSLEVKNEDRKKVVPHVDYKKILLEIPI